MALQASLNQGNSRFVGFGRQCVANSAVSIRLSKQLEPEKWDKATLDSILDSGDRLYVELTKNKNESYLSLEDIPKSVGFFSKPQYGNVAGHCESPFVTLFDGIKQCTDISQCGCIITLGTSSPGYSSAILKHNNAYYFFDPHSRNECGMLTGEGCATMTIHKDIDALCLFIRHLCASLSLKSNTQFEIARMHTEIENTSIDSDSDSEFSGFDKVSEGEYSCIMYLNEKIELSDISDTDISVSDVSEISDSEISENEENSFDENHNLSDQINELVVNLDNSETFLNVLDVDIMKSFCNDQGCNETCSINSKYQENEFENNRDENDIAAGKKGLLVDVILDENEGDDIRILNVQECHNTADLVGQEEIESNRIEGMGEEIQIENANSIIEIEIVQVEGVGEGQNENGNQSRKSRKRVRDENTWKRNVVKRKLNSGEKYVDRNGNSKRARAIKSGCGLSCKFKCHEKISESQRLKNFHEFWGYGSYDKQRHFLNISVDETAAKRVLRKSCKERKISRKYHFKLNSERIRVCKTFFLATLDISYIRIETAKTKCSPSGVTKNDKRGKHELRPNKISSLVINDVKDHINSFPRVESHYCRKNTSKEYLDGNLSLSKMYELYLKQCDYNNVVPIKESMYRYIFNTQFNISFHKPLKDQCDLCTEFHNLSKEGQENMLPIYQRHVKNKELARKSKEDCKKSAKCLEQHFSACFDLQQVLTLPKANQSSLYYSRKLNNYDLSVYSLGDSDSFCYLWNETLAKRGSCEIASCMFDFFEILFHKKIKTITTFSDNCSGQEGHSLIKSKK